MIETNEHTDNKPLLLLVENDQPSRDVVKIFLRNTCRVEFAMDAEAALNMVHSVNFDMILMDINLGKGMNGVELTRVIKSEERFKDLPIIALTAYAMAGDRESFLAAGCTHYLSKPFDKSTLIELIESIIKNNSPH